MHINVNNNSMANKLRQAMTTGNCIVLYHMSSCPHCVNMMPEWQKFKSSAPATLPGLIIGEVERNFIDMIPEAEVETFPTIKFYKAGAGATSGNNINNSQPQKNNNNIKYPKNATSGKLIDLLRNMMLAKQANSISNSNSNPAIVEYNDARTADNLIKFARNNISKGKAKIIAKTAKQVKNNMSNMGGLSKKTKRVKKARRLVLNNLTHSLSNLAEYKQAKANDKKVSSRINKKLNKLLNKSS